MATSLTAANRPAATDTAPLRVFAARLNLTRMIAVARQRRKLADLDPHLLEDIGVSREAALEEAGRPFWDIWADRVRRF